MNINYMVVRKRDSDPVEVYPFEDVLQANNTYEGLQENWTETFLCSVIRQPGRDSQCSEADEKFRMVVGALDAAFNGHCDTARLKQLAKDFLDHLEGAHLWNIVPPAGDLRKTHSDG